MEGYLLKSNLKNIINFILKNLVENLFMINLDKSKSIVKRFFITNDRNSKFYKFAKSMYYKIK